MKKKLIYFICLLALLSLLVPPLTFSVSAVSVGQNDLFVSPNGSDSNDGTLDAPLLSLAAAKEKVKASGVEEGVTVWLREGSYALSKELVFTSDDQPNVTYAAYDDGLTEITGAAPLTGFTEETVNGVKCFTKQLGADASFTSLNHSTETLTMTRYPETGAFTVKSVDEADNLFTKENAYWEAGLGNTSFNANKDDIKLSIGNGAYVRIVHRWLDEWSTATYEADIGKVRLGRPAAADIEPGDEYWFENVFAALDSPGEWYLDNTAHKLYYIPFDGEKADAITLYAGQTKRLITIDGCSGLRFEGITFCNTEWSFSVPKDNGSVMTANNIEGLQAGEDCDAALYITNADRVVFSHCDFLNLGNSAVKFDKNVHYCAVNACYFQNIGCSAIVIYGEHILADSENSNEICSDINLSENYIEGYGRLSYESVGIFLRYAKDCEISNNTIHDGHYSGISVGWMWSHDYQVTENIAVKDNLIYDIGQGWLGDLGGIYTLGEQKGTVLSGNVIYNVVCGRGKTSYGGNGIYCDAGSSFMTIENNLVYDCSALGVSISNFSDEQLIRNNIIAFCNQSLINPGICESDTVPCIASNNILLSDNSIVFLDVKPGHFTESGNIIWDITNGQNVFFSDGYNGNLPKARKISLKTAIKNGFTINDVIADPLFTDISKRDFTLKENSPALAAGFVPWDFTAAGISDGSTPGASDHGCVNVYSKANDLSAYDKSCSNFTWYDAWGERTIMYLLPVLALALTVFEIVLLKKHKEKLILLLPIVLFSAVSLYMAFVVIWADWFYAVSSGLFLAECGLFAVFAYRARKGEAASRKGEFAAWAASTLLLLGSFYGLIFLFNNIIVMGSAKSILLCYLMIAVYCSICLLLTVVTKNKKIEKTDKNN